jgi:hypothetical protein
MKKKSWCTVNAIIPCLCCMRFFCLLFSLFFIDSLCLFILSNYPHQHIRMGNNNFSLFSTFFFLENS